MCNYKILKSIPHGQISLCYACDHIRIAFCTTLFSLTRDQFYDFTEMADTLYQRHKLHLCRDKKTVRIPLQQGVAMLCSINELRVLLYLLKAATDELAHTQLFTFSKN